jgi:hypothetical protein
LVACNGSSKTQQWVLSDGVVPGSSTTTNIASINVTTVDDTANDANDGDHDHDHNGDVSSASAVLPKDQTGPHCWEISACNTKPKVGVSLADSCKKVPAATVDCSAHPCTCNGAWAFNSDGTITQSMTGMCLTKAPDNMLIVDTCTGAATQLFTSEPAPLSKARATSTPISVASAVTITIKQNGMCVDRAGTVLGFSTWVSLEER